jgi:uncharacterized protein (TIRG00374 family)
MSGYIHRSVDVVRNNGLWLTAILAVVVFLGLLVAGDGAAVAAALSRVSLETVLLVFGLVTVSYGIRFLKWAYYLRVLDIEVPLRANLLTFFSGLMLVVTPGKVGEVWKAWFLRDLEGVPVSRTSAVVGAERVTDLAALTMLASLGVFLYQQSLVVLVGMSIAFVLGFAVLQWRTLCLALLERAENLPVIGDFASELEQFYEDAYSLFRAVPLAVSMVISLLAWGLEGIALWVVLEGIAGSADVILSLFVFGLGSVVGAVSLLPGGLGATEASILGVLVAFGYDRAAAAGATLIIRIGTLWYGAILGTVVFGTYKL